MNIIKQLLLLFAVISIYSCAHGNYLSTQRTKPEEIEGTYTLILYGGRFMDDVENVAILDKEGDPYTFQVYSPEFDYTVQNGVPAKEALKQAEAFVRFHPAAHGSRLKRIIGKDGSIAGYEFTPFYSIAEFGSSDIVYTDYTVKDNKIIVRIWVRYEIEQRDNMLFRGMDWKK